ncbi:MAG TPA: hypothetical protein VGD43_16495 [Micromonospora sp.]
MRDTLTRFLRWSAARRPLVMFVAAVVWTAIIYPFVDNAFVAALCGIAFGAVIAQTLPRPPRSSPD